MTGVVSRRVFLGAAGAAAVAPWTRANPLWASDRGIGEIRVGVIGCGGRGSGAAINSLQADPGTVITGMADLFPDRLTGSRNSLSAHETLGGRARVTDETCFTGFDAFQRLLDEADVDLVILATPPHFRPIHLEAAVAAGKHVFMEKPVAVDPVGARRVIAAGKMADEKGLTIVAGTQRRHQESYLDAMTRIKEGAIGEVVSGCVFWNQGGLWAHDRVQGETDMEWQLRNWLYFAWTSGDHICEQHIHNLDVANWVMGGPPERALGSGGREVRTDPRYGNIYDHFTTLLTYSGGRQVTSMCRQIDGTPSRVKEEFLGPAGRAVLSHGGCRIEGRAGDWESGPDATSPFVQEHIDLIASIRGEIPRLNEAKRVAESTLTAVMARMSAYTGKEVTWDFVRNASVLDLSPPQYVFGDLETRPVPVPGTTPLI